MNIIDIIIKKRDNKKLSKEEIDFFIRGCVDESIQDCQISALLMAICINGLDDEETAYLTQSMAYSGNVLDLSEIEGLKADKHSTGGVGDSTTLILAPLVSSAGLPVIKMSGRGLGHTGGTADKLETISGFNLNIGCGRAIENVKKYGLALMTQTADIAPADKKLYSIRDITGTTENISLIASSIMSKKIAAGSDAIVLDVKCGNGAFMKNIEDARRLAEIMIKSAKNNGKKAAALITDMNEPLGMNIGNSLEVMEAIDILKGRKEGALKTVSLELGAHMLKLAGIIKDIEEGRRILNRNILNGKGIEKFKKLIEIQGGDSSVINDFSKFPLDNAVFEVRSPKSGYISSVDTRKIGNASVELGAGRRKKEDKLDLGAGFVLKKRLGDRIERNEVLAVIYARTEKLCLRANEMLLSAYEISDIKPEKQKLIIDIIE